MTETRHSTELQTRIKKLHELVEKTSKCRFGASKRLNSHKNWSMWTVALMSVLITAFSVMQALNMGNSANDKLITFTNIMLSTFILVYSLILSMSDFGLKAMRHHQCGMDLNRLRGILYSETLKEDDNERRYKELNEKYADILDRYENHEDIDYQFMQISSATMISYYKISFMKKQLISIHYNKQFWHYIIVLVIGFGLFSWAMARCIMTNNAA